MNVCLVNDFFLIFFFDVSDIHPTAHLVWLREYFSNIFSSLNLYLLRCCFDGFTLYTRLCYVANWSFGIFICVVVASIRLWLASELNRIDALNRSKTTNT